MKKWLWLLRWEYDFNDLKKSLPARRYPLDRFLYSIAGSLLRAIV